MDDARPIKFEAEAVYSKAALAAAFSVSERCIEKWSKGRNRQLPRPFYVGRRPMWKGQALNGFMDKRQAEAVA